MRDDSIKRLQRANPVTEPLPIPPFAVPVEQDGDERPVVLVRRRRSHARRNGALALTGVAGAAALSILLASGSSNSPVDVLAAVYAATAPRAGIVESVTVVRNDFGPGQRRSERLREWLQASPSRGRALIAVSGSRGSTSADIVYSGHTWEAWTAGAPNGVLPLGNAAHNTIQRVQWSGSVGRGQLRVGFGGGLVGEQWTQTFHTLYLKHQFHVAGQVRRGGRLLWKLEETAARAHRRAREDATSYYVLVDPHTFLPVYTRLSSLARVGHPPISEVELLSVRTLPATAANERLFDLTQLHPGVRVVTHRLSVPLARSNGRAVINR